MKKYGPPNRINVKMPAGWVASKTGLPDMTSPSDAELEAGYEGSVWAASCDDKRLEVRWMGNHAKYFCRAYMAATDAESPTEARSFDYPHEVIDWLTMWFQHMGPFAGQLE